MRANAPQLPGGGGMGAVGIDWCISCCQDWFKSLVNVYFHGATSKTHWKTSVGDK